MVVAPDGSVVAAAGAEPELLVVDLDLDRVGATRENIPVLANRRI
jgi:deaminated glutathione amidase